MLKKLAPDSLRKLFNYLFRTVAVANVFQLQPSYCYSKRDISRGTSALLVWSITMNSEFLLIRACESPAFSESQHAGIQLELEYDECQDGCLRSSSWDYLPMEVDLY